MQHLILNTNWFSWRRGWELAVILVGLVVGGILIDTAHALDSASVNLAGQIIFRNEKLTAKITTASLREVMAEISQVSGVQIRWLDAGGEEPVSVHFVALPLSEAIQRLLGERNFLLFYSSTGEGAHLTQIWIASRKTGKEQPAGLPPASEQPPILSTEDTTQEEVIPPDLLLQTALYDRGLSARLEAITQLEGYSHQDPRVAAALSHLADNDHEPQVREVAAAVLETIE